MKPTVKSAGSISERRAVSSDQTPSLDALLDALRQFSRPASEHGTVPVDESYIQPPPANVDGARTMLEALNRFAGFRSTPALERKLAQVLRNAQSEEIEKLVKQACSAAHSNDLQAIVEDLTNHETFFFRDMMQLIPLRDVLMPEIIDQRRKGHRRIRIWSAASATGEEVYTLAMMALQAMVRAGAASFSAAAGYQLQDDWQLEVLGTDISRQAIRRARQGVYEASSFGSFRQMPSGWERDFVTVSQGPGRHGVATRFMTLLPSIIRHVRFDTFNLVSANPPILNCDVVVCRNVMIYLDSERHPAMHAMLARALRPGGVFIPSLVDQVSCSQLEARWIDRCPFYEKRG